MSLYRMKWSENPRTASARGRSESDLKPTGPDGRSRAPATPARPAPAHPRIGEAPVVREAEKGLHSLGPHGCAPSSLRSPAVFSVRKSLPSRPHRETDALLSEGPPVLGSPHQTLPAATPPHRATDPDTAWDLSLSPGSGLPPSHPQYTPHSSVTWGKCSGLAYTFALHTEHPATQPLSDVSTFMGTEQSCPPATDMEPKR